MELKLFEKLEHEGYLQQLYELPELGDKAYIPYILREKCNNSKICKLQKIILRQPQVIYLFVPK